MTLNLFFSVISLFPVFLTRNLTINCDIFQFIHLDLLQFYGEVNLTISFPGYLLCTPF